MLQIIENHPKVHKHADLTQQDTGIILITTFFLVRGAEVVEDSLVEGVLEDELEGKILPVVVLLVELVDVPVLDHCVGDFGGLLVGDPVQHYWHEQDVAVEGQWLILKK